MNIKKITLLFIVALFSLSANSKQNDNSFNHFRLDYYSANNKLKASACADEGCNSLYEDKKTKLHLTEDNGNQGLAVKFHDLEDGSQTVDYTIVKGLCVSLKLQANSSKPKNAPLQCFVDGKATLCNEICNEEVSRAPLAAYVYGNIILNETSMAMAVPNYSYAISSISGKGKLIDVGNGNQELKKDSAVSFPLTVSYDKAENIELVIKGDNGEKNNNKRKEIEFKLELTFVPKVLKWVTTAVCENEDGFSYEQHAGSCNVLGKAGEKITLSLALNAYGETPSGGLLLISGYTADLMGIKIRMLDAEGNDIQEISETNLTFNQNRPTLFEPNNPFDTIALIQANLPRHCASYANDCALKTSGDTAIIGRTVPDRLLINGVPGTIKGNIAYRGKPVDFDQKPQFTVKGCAVGQAGEQCSLPSYSGEFAKGLTLENLSLTAVDGFTLTPTITEGSVAVVALDESTAGIHSIKLSNTKLTFDKADKQPATPVDHKLSLAINIPHDADLVGQGDGKVAKDADLRFGYLRLEDTELPINTDGHIRGELYYLDTSTNPVREESHFSFASDVANDAGITIPVKKPSDATLPSLAVDNDGLGIDGIGVMAYEQAAEFNVELAVDKWLKPYGGHTLVQPTAVLKFTSDARKRGNDRVFNRREVVR